MPSMLQQFACCQKSAPHCPSAGQAATPIVLAAGLWVSTRMAALAPQLLIAVPHRAPGWLLPLFFTQYPIKVVARIWDGLLCRLAGEGGGEAVHLRLAQVAAGAQSGGRSFSHRA